MTAKPPNRTEKRRTASGLTGAAAICLSLLSACNVGPRYTMPPASTSRATPSQLTKTGLCANPPCSSEL